MSKPNAVKFSFLVNKADVKMIIISSLDHDVQLTYPQLKDAPELVKIKGVSPMGEFEKFIEGAMLRVENYFDRISFFQNLKFKLVELNVNPAELPAGAEKEVNLTQVKK
jgi:hypothetical protein